MKTIAPADLCRKMTAGEQPRLLDVRTPREYATAHVPGARLEPLENFDAARVAGQLASAPEPVYVICQSGTRARTAIAKLEKAGLDRCVLVEGGTQGWIEAGLPVEKRAVGGISLERQVRIAAGALVLAGTVPGYFWHPAFLLLPGFVGAGLMFAGITDICGMGMLLGRMPWNQIRNQDCACSTAQCAEGGSK
jgi:rhodanese-related sulfurtransferase